MAREVNLRKGDLAKPGLVGFSWTMLFFGFFVPLLRGDFKWTLILLVLCVLSFGLANFVFCFFYNKIYTTNLLENGYVPADDYSREVLVRAGLIVPSQQKRDMYSPEIGVGK